MRQRKQYDQTPKKHSRFANWSSHWLATNMHTCLRMRRGYKAGIYAAIREQQGK